MAREFEMADIGLMSFYLGLEVRQSDDGIFVGQQAYVKEVLDKFNMSNSKSVATPMEARAKLSKDEKGEKVDPPLFKSLMGCLSMHQDFYGWPRLDGPLASITTYSTMELSPADYALFKVIVNCILPIITWALAAFRPMHVFIIYALSQSLDVNIALNMFQCIIHFTRPAHGMIHMSFDHVITEWLESMGGDVTYAAEGVGADAEVEAGSDTSESEDDVRAQLLRFDETMDTRFEELQLERDLEMVQIRGQLTTLARGMTAALAVGLMVAACVVAAEDCSNVLTDLLDCLPYVSNGSNTSSPSAGCCIGVTDVVIGSPACICDALKQARELGVELNTSRVLALPAACDVKEPEIRCGGEIPPASSPCESFLICVIFLLFYFVYYLFWSICTHSAVKSAISGATVIRGTFFATAVANLRSDSDTYRLSASTSATTPSPVN
ncbi:hypothetical protein ZIOFF_008942 [Zingiber officinale]|uniref:Bifunctional inhibitor/plant lipid transfer protein/seed storage helical domain-containing protein n=1 Tax=Zingiber officinale TaxID=94328 RepID=A0A8J5I418_ZINOF|nr:hypothetical protein ZIOFF_008942 [Zingiber officinale]